MVSKCETILTCALFNKDWMQDIEEKDLKRHTKIRKLLKTLKPGEIMAFDEVSIKTLCFNKENIYDFDTYPLMFKLAKERDAEIDTSEKIRVDAPNLRCDFVIVKKTLDGKLKFTVIELNGSQHYTGNPKKLAKRIANDAVKAAALERLGANLFVVNCSSGYIDTQFVENLLERV